MNWLATSASIALALTAGAVGSVFTARSIRNWYPGLAKPPWNPPSWVFGPVWTVLYVLMGVSAALVWSQPESMVRTAALAVYAVQLALNALWSYLFFGLRRPMTGFVGLVALWIGVVATAVLSWRVSSWAGWLLVPYVAWVSFAGVLNYRVAELNP